jgi:hypothetical protein
MNTKILFASLLAVGTLFTASAVRERTKTHRPKEAPVRREDGAVKAKEVTKILNGRIVTSLNGKESPVHLKTDRTRERRDKALAGREARLRFERSNFGTGN